MGETARQIETRIEQTREDLGSNLRELESRVKSATDWREHFRSNPLLWAGVAFGGGVFLGTLTSRQNPASAMSFAGLEASARTGGGSSRAKRHVLEAWDNIKTALVAVATARVMEVLGEAIPGFEEHLRRTDSDRTRPFQNRSASTMGSASGGGKAI
jgi:hypothetical protein